MVTMKNIHTQTKPLSTHKNSTHINVRQVPDSGYHISVISKVSTEYAARHKSGGSGSALKPQANPPDSRLQY